MIVNGISGVKVLRAGGATEVFIGTLTLEAIKKVIGADLVEVLMTCFGDAMIIDESGKLNVKTFNKRATMLYKYGIDRYGKMLDWIVGDVVVIPQKVFEEWDKETIELYEDKDM